METTNICRYNKLDTTEMLYPAQVEKEFISSAVKEDNETYIRNRVRTVKNKKELSHETGLEVGAICGKHFLKRGRLALGLQLAPSPPRPLLGTGRQEDLALCVGKDNCSLVAALGDTLSVPATSRCSVTSCWRTRGLSAA